MTEVYSLIRQAILNKDQVLADYHGYHREMCPHVIGTKNGREQALFYQFAGESSSGLALAGSPANWRCIVIEDLENVTTVSGPWHSSDVHTRDQTCVGDIDVEVAY